MSMKCLTVSLLLLLLVSSQPAHHLRKSLDSPFALKLQQSIQASEVTSKLVSQDLALLRLIVVQDLADQDSDQVRRVVAEDKVKVATAVTDLTNVIKEVEEANMRAEVSLLYRAGNESVKRLQDIDSDLDELCQSLKPEVAEMVIVVTEPQPQPPQPVVSPPPMRAIVLPTPSVDQMLQIAICLETLLRAHKDANDILDEIQGQQEAIEKQQAALNQRKQILRGEVISKAETLQRHKELVADAKEKVGKALEALMDSERLLEEKAKMIDDLQTRVLANV